MNLHRIGQHGIPPKNNQWWMAWEAFRNFDNTGNTLSIIRGADHVYNPELIQHNMIQ